MITSRDPKVLLAMNEKVGRSVDTEIPDWNFSLRIVSKFVVSLEFILHSDLT
jgi:hypothetical protein